MSKEKQGIKWVKDPIPKELFEILACPTCKSDLQYTNNKKALLCLGCGVKYKIEKGIPILLPSEFAAN